MLAVFNVYALAMIDKIGRTKKGQKPYFILYTFQNRKFSDYQTGERINGKIDFAAVFFLSQKAEEKQKKLRAKKGDQIVITSMAILTEDWLDKDKWGKNRTDGGQQIPPRYYFRLLDFYIQKEKMDALTEKAYRVEMTIDERLKKQPPKHQDTIDDIPF